MAGLTIVSDTAFVRMVCEAPTMRERSRYKLATPNEFSQHYLKLVSKADAKAFRNIFPEETLKAAE